MTIESVNILTEEAMTDNATPQEKLEPCDDAQVMRIWRECGMPEYFLGNGGTNNKLVEFASRLRTPTAQAIRDQALEDAAKADAPKEPPYYDDDPCYPAADPYQKGYEEGLDAKSHAIRALKGKTRG